MAMLMDDRATVRRSVRVKATAERAFRVFTREFDSWWPRGHHIGTGSLKRAVIEERLGGRCYGEEEDGTRCPWGTVTAWDPPRLLGIAWQINGDWTYQPDLARASEVRITFTDEGDGHTRVDVEHRHLERHGEGADAMRAGVGGEGGWGDLLAVFAARIEDAAQAPPMAE